MTGFIWTFTSIGWSSIGITSRSKLVITNHCSFIVMDWLKQYLYRYDFAQVLPIKLQPVKVKVPLQVGESALRVPNLGLDCSFCHWVARPRLTQKECFFSQTPAVLASTARHGTALHGTARHGTALHGTARYGTARHGAVRYGAVRYGTVRNGTVRCGTVRYGTVR